MPTMRNIAEMKVAGRRCRFKDAGAGVSRSLPYKRTAAIHYDAVEPAGVRPDAGYLDLVQVATEAWKLGVPRELLPFCESNGDYFCLGADGRVVYWSDAGETDESWPDLAHWIREVWIEEQEEEEEE